MGHYYHFRMKSSRILLFNLILLTFVIGQNILINPSFEIWLDTLGVNMPLGWFTSEFNFPGSATKTTDAHTGNFALKLIGGDSIAFATTTALVQANRQYNFNGWCKCPSYLGGSFILNWLSLFGNPVGIPTIFPITMSTNYRNYSGTVTAPDSAVFVLVTVSALPQATVYVDDVTLDSIVSELNENQISTVNQGQVTLQPNPFTNQTLIQLSNPEPPFTKLEIYDLTGKLVKSFSGKQNCLVWEGTDDAGVRLRPGLYFARVTIAGKTFTQKIIILER